MRSGERPTRSRQDFQKAEGWWEEVTPETMERPVRATDFGRKSQSSIYERHLEFTRNEEVMQRAIKVMRSKDSSPRSFQSIAPAPARCMTSCFLPPVRAGPGRRCVHRRRHLRD